MRHWVFKLEIFSSILGVTAGLATAFFDRYLLTNPQVPIKALPNVLSLDVIYVIFFQIFLYGFLFNVKRFTLKNIFIGTSFFILAQLLAYALVFLTLPSLPFMARFLKAFPGRSLSSALLDSSISRLTWPFFLMLLTLGVARLLKLSRGNPSS